MVFDDQRGAVPVERDAVPLGRTRLEDLIAIDPYPAQLASPQGWISPVNTELTDA